MGAIHSRDTFGAWSVSVPRYQLVRLGEVDMQRLVIPETVVAACKIINGESIYLQDCLGRSFGIVLQQKGGVYSLGDGWASLLKQFEAVAGDEALLKYKGGQTWKIRLFTSSCGSEKFPVNQGLRAGSSTFQTKHVVTEDSLGSRNRPIDIDDTCPDAAVYNATGKPLNMAMRDFFNAMAATYKLMIPMYYTTVSAYSMACDFFTLSKDYGLKYAIPMLEDEGYPDQVQMFLNGADEPSTVTFVAFPKDGNLVLSEGVSLFLEKNGITDGSEVALRFDLTQEWIKIFVYPFN